MVEVTSYHRRLFEDRDYFTQFMQAYVGKGGLNFSLSITDRCTLGCLHCNVSALPYGKSAPFNSLERIDPRYYKSGYLGLYSDGEPLDYGYDGRSFTDVVIMFYGKGAKKIGFLTQGFIPNNKEKIDLVQRLKVLKEQGIRFQIGLSFNLYPPVKYEEKAYQFAKERFVFSVQNLAALTEKINVQLRGDVVTRYRNIGLMYRAIEEALRELGATKRNGEIYVPGLNLTLTFNTLLAQPVGRMAEVLEQGKVALLTEEERRDLMQKFKITNEYFKSGQKRWIDLKQLNSMHVHTDGGVDVLYSVPVLGSPRRIANIYQQTYEEVIAAWIVYLWENFIYPNRSRLEDIILRGEHALYETEQSPAIKPIIT